MTPGTDTAPTPTQSVTEPTRLPPLEPFDRLDQPTFHARYEAMPEHVRAELIGGVVHMPSPLKLPHGRMTRRLASWLVEYGDATPGVDGCDNATTILGDDSEPQPDASLFIAPEYGGQSSETVEEYICGAPELLVEVASCSEAVDLHAKRDDYLRAGVKEYIVVALRQAQVFWFVLRDGRYQVLTAGADGVVRSEVFPGLWLDPAALLRHDAARIREVTRQGLASPEHAAFVAQLAARKPPAQP